MEQSTLISEFWILTMNKKAWIFPMALLSTVLSCSSAKAESLGQRCQSSRSDCDAIYNSSQLIISTYNADNTTAPEQLAKLGWDANHTRVIESKFFVDPNDPEKKKKIAIDAQVIISQKEVDGKTIYLFSFRGTETQKTLQNPLANDLGTDANGVLTDFGSGKVHRGFLDYMNSLKADPRIQSILKEITAKPKNSSYEIIVTGHSLGGAAAQLFSASLQISENIQPQKIKNVVFGSPSVGNKDFTNAYLGNTLRVEASLDGIPRSTMVANIVIPSWLKNGDYNHSYGQVIQIASSQKIREQLNEYEKKIRALEEEKKLLRFYEIKRGFEIDQEIAGLKMKEVSLMVSDAHLEYPERINVVYERQLASLLNNMSTITQGGSSHIGSASYYLGRSPNKDEINLENAYRVDQFNSARIQSVQEGEQYTTPSGSITNLRAPVDVVLNWNQSVAQGQLDLDSHLTGPTGLGDNSSVRFHTYFSSKGSLNTAPYVLLYRDVIPANGGSGNEQTRVQVLQNGVYRFYVHDFTNRNTTGSTALSQSGANVTVFNFGRDLPAEGQNLGTPLGGAINVPINQQGNVWRAFELDSRTGVLKPINAPFGNVSDPAKVPTVGGR
jgi:Lipase (class 3)